MKINFLSIILTTLFIIILILNNSSISKEKNAIKIANEMGIGYNLGNSFDCYDINVKIKNPNEQIILLGNPIPTRKLISNNKFFRL